MTAAGRAWTWPTWIEVTNLADAEFSLPSRLWLLRTLLIVGEFCAHLILIVKAAHSDITVEEAAAFLFDVGWYSTRTCSHSWWEGGMTVFTHLCVASSSDYLPLLSRLLFPIRMKLLIVEKLFLRLEDCEGKNFLDNWLDPKIVCRSLQEALVVCI